MSFLHTSWPAQHTHAQAIHCTRGEDDRHRHGGRHLNELLAHLVACAAHARSSGCTIMATADIMPRQYPVALYPTNGEVWQTLSIGKAPGITNNLIISGAVHCQMSRHCLGVVCQT